MKTALGFLAACLMLCTATKAYASVREFNDLLYFEGVWDCEGKAREAANNTLHDVSSLYTVTSMLNSSWLQATIFEQHDGAAVHIASRTIGYDATWKRYVAYEAGQNGVWTFLSSADSASSSMAWTGYLHNYRGHLARALQENLRRVSDDAFTVSSSFKDLHGEWTTLYDGSCHRQAK